MKIFALVHDGANHQLLPDSGDDPGFSLGNCSINWISCYFIVVPPFREWRSYRVAASEGPLFLTLIGARRPPVIGSQVFLNHISPPGK